MRIAIDLTPLLPGGANGGVKIMALRLVSEIAKLAPNDEFILLTSTQNTHEISAIKTHNMQINCVLDLSAKNLKNILKNLLRAPIHFAIRIARKKLPLSIVVFLKNFYHFLLKMSGKQTKINTINHDILFCPFTAPFFHNPNIPTISVVLDLQSHYYPFFFTSEECYDREKNFRSACQKANKLVCISDFVRQTVIEKSNIKPEQVKTIHIRTAHRLPNLEKCAIQTTLEQYELVEHGFLLYPANFWPHKNHQALFTAFNNYHAKYPSSKIKLVCTGTNNHYKTFLQEAVKTMGLQDQIIFSGYLTDEELASLIKSCRAMIFPTLYEGFGMPVLEAMANGKPVLCSNTTSLPEIAGDAALLFDPRKPEEITHAIYRLENEPGLVEKLIQSGYKQVALFGTETDMAKEYLQLFYDTLYEANQSRIESTHL